VRISEKIDFLKEHHMREFLDARETVADELSNTNKLFCICGKLATGLHESMCRKFSRRVDEITANKIYPLMTLANQATHPRHGEIEKGI